MFGWLKRDPKKDLIKILGEADLPSFPAVVNQALAQLRDPDKPLMECGELIAQDPGLSAKILKLSNSAAFSLKHSVKNVPHAVSMLGRSQVEGVLLATGVAAALPRKPGDGFDPNVFWRTSARRAAAAAALAGELHPATRQECFTAALLQDMAVPLLSARREGYGEVLSAAHGASVKLAELEHEQFGWSHPEVATMLCAEWKFPERLAGAIGAHHGQEGQGLEAPPAVQLVALLAESADNDGLPAMLAAANDNYGLSEDRAVELVEEADGQAETLAKLFAA